MNKALIIFPLLLLLFAGLPGIRPSAGEDVPEAGSLGGTSVTDRDNSGNELAAKVNGVGIAEKSVLSAMRSMSARKGPQEGGEDGGEDVREQALNILILQELAYQRAKAQGLDVEPENILKAVERLKENLGGGEGYRKHLEAEAMTGDELTKQVEKNIVLNRMFRKEVFDRVVVSEEELQKAYENQRGKFFRPEKIAVTDVIFFLDPGDKDSVRKAEEALKKIHDDSDKNPRSLTQDGSFIVRDLNLRKEQEPELYEEAKKLGEGELSGIIKAADSLHIIKLEKYQPEKLHTFEEARGLLEGQLKSEALRKRTREWEAELKKDARIEIIETKESTQ